MIDKPPPFEVRNELKKGKAAPGGDAKAEAAPASKKGQAAFGDKGAKG